MAFDFLKSKETRVSKSKETHVSESKETRVSESKETCQRIKGNTCQLQCSITALGIGSTLSCLREKKMQGFEEGLNP